MQGHDGPFYLGICLIITNYPIKSVTCRDGRVNTCVRKPGKTRVGALAAVILSKPHSNSGPFSLNMALTFFLTLPRQALVFTCLQSKSLKELREKEKLLIMSNSPFPILFSTRLEKSHQP